MPDLGIGGWLGIVLALACLGLIVEGVARDRQADRKERRR